MQRPGIRPVTKESLAKPVIFHDGRLVQKHTPLVAPAIILWFPIGVPLSILRLIIGSMVPLSTTYYITNLLGCTIRIKGTPPPHHPKHSAHDRGVLCVCSHRTLAHAVIVTVSLSRPIRSVGLTRERGKDAKRIEEMLEQGKEVVIFPEGTTCREPYLLRFSSLFAELTDQIVPVAVALKTNMFYGNTARGYKGLDLFLTYMNPMPVYEITFLDKLSDRRSCKGGKSIHEVADDIQEIIGKTLNYKCTDLTRKDKYRTLAGRDGRVEQKPTAVTTG